MVKLIKKGGLRERANRSHKFQGSENTETTLKPNSYADTAKKTEIENTTSTPISIADTTPKTSE
ncbi:hypothetical protein [Acinetobacter zhairhuonensis]|jgi:hypothetical protein|uniref:hypothetical protein n=1 Tax=Acinetobacter sp. A7.4 TaxID=2919921 RepID=UPI001F4ED5FD|nr:hypothetical protein [Acinetobacter sp. A7.4]MCJ8160279.1 hypothetical protein [Acinetobacter sp. A7.4]